MDQRETVVLDKPAGDRKNIGVQPKYAAAFDSAQADVWALSSLTDTNELCPASQSNQWFIYFVIYIQSVTIESQRTWR